LRYAENGSLRQTLNVFGKLNEHLVASYTVKILEGLCYLHNMDIVHGSLKASNILTTKSGNIKLSDFKASLNLRAIKGKIPDVTGNANWMAPEVIELKGASPKSDIWSLACTVIELLTGQPPYTEITNSMSVMFRIVEDDKPLIPEECSKLLQDFLTQCFQKDPTKRPNAGILCEHPWVKSHFTTEPQELRSQDSLPFRHVTAKLQRSEAALHPPRILTADLATVSNASQVDGETEKSSPSRRNLNFDARGSSDPTTPSKHSFVKVSFSKGTLPILSLVPI
jgi:serine/threonine protein kinase